MKSFIFTIFIWICTTFILFANDNNIELKKISNQLNTIKTLYESGVLEKNEYENSKKKLQKRIKK